jgi:pimeloyl-ACP methyl ester carboxylesterase
VTNPKTIVFIHGLFQNPRSWVEWKSYFERHGYTCLTPAYPFHEGEPSKLRTNPNPALKKLMLGEVVSHVARSIEHLVNKPLLIGHSMGGLIVQKLISMDLGAAGVCIDSAPPAGIRSFKWSFIRANFPTVNPLQGNSICMPDVNWFHYAFCNTMSKEETKEAYNLFFVPESRNIPRSSVGPQGKIDFSKSHKPLLFIAGEMDNIIPSSLNRENANAYSDRNSKVDFKEFPGRTHFICGQRDWIEVADYTKNWIESISPSQFLKNDK